MKYFLLILFMTCIQAQATCLDHLKNDHPNERYNASIQGWAIDKQTNLMWMRCAIGSGWENNCSSVDEMSFVDAVSISENTEFSGFSDWRLPNVKELSSLVARNCIGPTINENVFINFQSKNYWTSTSKGNYGKIWSVGFIKGNINYEQDSYWQSMILVRDVTD